MDNEVLAGELAEAYYIAERKLARLKAKAAQYCDAVNVPPVTRSAIVNGIAAAEAAVAQSHLAITPYDVRPTTQDGGGK